MQKNKQIIESSLSQFECKNIEKLSMINDDKYYRLFINSIKFFSGSYKEIERNKKIDEIVAVST